MITRLTHIVARIITYVPAHGLGECHRSSTEQKDHREKDYDELFLSEMNHVILLFSQSLIVSYCQDCPCYLYIQTGIKKGHRKFCDLCHP